MRLSDEGAVCRENNSFADIIVHLKTEKWYIYYIDILIYIEKKKEYELSFEEKSVLKP